MSTIRIGIVEDEMIIAETISSSLQKLGYEVAFIAAGYDTAISLIEKEKPDLLVLDIRLRGYKDGIDLGWYIKQNYDTPFIFLTANSDPATIEKVKFLDPPAFLVKPFNSSELYAAIEICLYNSSKQKGFIKQGVKPEELIINDALFIKEGPLYYKVPFKEILYLEKDHVYLHIQTNDKVYTVRATIEEYLEKLNHKKFIQVHRSYIVNIDRVDAINEIHLIMGDKKVPIAKNFRSELLSNLKLG
jgi:two-component system, LytTR family, response regulator LytT